MSIAAIMSSIRCCRSSLGTALVLSFAFLSAQAFAQSGGSIMIHKTASGAAANQEFSFTGSGSLGEFTLVNGQFRTFSGLASGTYTVTENATEGWRIDHIECLAQSGDSSTSTTSSDGVTIHLSSGGFVECEVVNVTSACGDGVLDSGEFCDPGITDDTDPNFVEGCRTDCTFCGDGEVNGGEECDFNGDANCSQECSVPGAVKIVKRMVSHNFETIPADGFRFVGDFDPSNEFNLRADTIRVFTDLSGGEHTFFELPPMVPAPNGGADVESQGWDITSVDCVCLISEAGQTCGSTFTSNLDNRDEQLVDAPAPVQAVLGSFTVNVVGGETVVCTVTNEDQVCPPGQQSPPAGTTNNNQTQNTNNSGGLASTNVPATTATGSGCSSTGVGIAGLSTMLMLAMPLLALRLRRRAKA